MPKFPFSCDLRTEAERYRTVFGRRRVVVASKIVLTLNYTKNKKCRKNVARRHVIGASHDPRTVVTGRSFGERKVFACRFRTKHCTINVCSCDDGGLVVHELLKVHEDHMATVRSPYGSHKEDVRRPCDFFVCLRRQHDDRTISLRSPHGLSTTLHRSIVETRQRNRTMAVLM